MKQIMRSRAVWGGLLLFVTAFASVHAAPSSSVVLTDGCLGGSINTYYSFFHDTGDYFSLNCGNASTYCSPFQDCHRLADDGVNSFDIFEGFYASPPTFTLIFEEKSASVTTQVQNWCMQLTQGSYCTWVGASIQPGESRRSSRTHDGWSFSPGNHGITYFNYNMYIQNLPGTVKVSAEVDPAPFRLVDMAVNTTKPYGSAALSGRVATDLPIVVFTYLGSSWAETRTENVSFVVRNATGFLLSSIVTEEMLFPASGLSSSSVRFTTKISAQSLNLEAGSYEVALFTGSPGTVPAASFLDVVGLTVLSNDPISLPHTVNFDSMTFDEWYGKFEVERHGLPGAPNTDFFSNVNRRDIVKVVGGRGVYPSYGLGLYTDSAYGLPAVVLNFNMASYTVASISAIALRLYVKRESIRCSDNAPPFLINVEVRGNESDPWIVATTLVDIDPSNSDDENVWQPVAFEFSDILQSGGQEFSAASQLRLFSDRCYTTWASLDDVSIQSESLDVAVDWLQSPPAWARAGQEFLVHVQVESPSFFSAAVSVTFTGPGNEVQLQNIVVLPESTSTLTFAFDTSALPLNEAQIVTLNLTFTGDTNTLNNNLEHSFVVLSNPPVTLPFLETWEGTVAANVTSFSADLFGIPGAQAWDFESAEGDGRLSFNTATAFRGSACALLDSPNEDSAKNFLTLTLNLNSYSLDRDRILLSFEFARFGTDTDPTDAVSARGSPNDEWVSLMALSSSAPSGSGLADRSSYPGEYERVTDLDVSYALRHAGQGLSAATQIRFGQRSSFYEDGLVFDEILIREAHDDAAITAVLPTGRFVAHRDMARIGIAVDVVGDVPGLQSQYILDGGTPVVEALDSSLLRDGNRLRHAFAVAPQVAAALTTYGNHSLAVSISSSSDTVSNNNERSTDIEVVAGPAIGLIPPFAEPFDSSDFALLTADSSLYEGGGSLRQSNFNYYGFGFAGAFSILVGGSDLWVSEIWFGAHLNNGEGFRAWFREGSHVGHLDSGDGWTPIPAPTTVPVFSFCCPKRVEVNFALKADTEYSFVISFPRALDFLKSFLPQQVDHGLFKVNPGGDAVRVTSSSGDFPMYTQAQQLMFGGFTAVAKPINETWPLKVAEALDHVPLNDAAKFSYGKGESSTLKRCIALYSSPAVDASHEVKLWLNLAASGFSALVHREIKLDFAYTAFGPQAPGGDTENRVWIADADAPQLPRLELFNWGSDRSAVGLADGVFRVVRNEINISSILAAAGRDFTAGTHVIFGARTNASSATPGFLLDSIRVHLGATDVGVSAIQLSLPARQLRAGGRTEGFSVGVETRNYFSDGLSVANVSVEYAIDSGLSVPAVASGPILEGNHETISFPMLTTAPAPGGTHKVAARTRLAPDSNPENDAFNLEFQVRNNEPITLPFFEDFEDFDACTEVPNGGFEEDLWQIHGNMYGIAISRSTPGLGPHGGAFALRITSSTGGSGTPVGISKAIDISSLSPVLRWTHGNNWQDVPIYSDVFYQVSIYSDSTLTTRLAVLFDSNTDFRVSGQTYRRADYADVEESVDLSAFINTTVFLAFELTRGSFTEVEIYIDNVRLDGTCIPFSGTRDPSTEGLVPWKMTNPWEVDIKSGPGRLRSNAVAPDAQLGGTHSVTLDSAIAGQHATNELTLFLNMEAYSVAIDQDICLFFQFHHSGDESDPEDAVMVRSSGDTWLLAYDLRDRVADHGWQLTPCIQLSSILAAGGQEYDAKFELRFSQADDYPAPQDGYSFDNVFITKGSSFTTGAATTGTTATTATTGTTATTATTGTPATTATTASSTTQAAVETSLPASQLTAAAAAAGSTSASSNAVAIAALVIACMLLVAFLAFVVYFVISRNSDSGSGGGSSAHSREERGSEQAEEHEMKSSSEMSIVSSEESA